MNRDELKLAFQAGAELSAANPKVKIDSLFQVWFGLFSQLSPEFISKMHALKAIKADPALNLVKVKDNHADFQAFKAADFVEPRFDAILDEVSYEGDRAHGRIRDDSKRRFINGEAVTTSVVLRVEGDYIYTRNSVYKIGSLGKTVVK